MAAISISIPDKLLSQIDEVVDGIKYRSKSDFFTKAAVRELGDAEKMEEMRG